MCTAAPASSMKTRKISGASLFKSRLIVISEAARRPRWAVFDGAGRRRVSEAANVIWRRCCSVYTGCLEGCASVGGRTSLAWAARRPDPPLPHTVSHSPSFPSRSGPCDGLGEINASSTACREIKLVFSDQEKWRA